MLTTFINDLSTITSNKIFNVLLIILIALLLQRLSVVITRQLFKFTFQSDLFPSTSLDKQRRAKTLNGVFGAIFSAIIWFIALLAILQILGIPLAPILTSAGLVGAALAFGTQSLIKDFISGLFIIFENQYRIDDYIELDKVAGQVKAIGIRTTVLRDEQNKLHYIPNGTITATTNLSMGSIIAHEKLEVENEMAIEKVEKSIQSIAKKLAEVHPAVIKDGPKVLSVDSVNQKTTIITICFKVTAQKRREASSLIWQEIKKSDITLS